MKNPLRKRILRELRGEFGKYLVIFLLMTLTIGFISGYLIAGGSMKTAFDNSFSKYNIENGNFRLQKAANKAQLSQMRDLGIQVYENYYIEEKLTGDQTLRIFKDRTEVNLECIMEGRMPERSGEIAIDRMFADNNSISVGDTIESASCSWTVTGFISLPDYTALYSNNNDTMFDAMTFGTALVTQEEFDSYNSSELYYDYSWKYDIEPDTEEEEKIVSDDLKDELKQIVHLKSYIPRYLNNAINFAGEDIGSDKIMMTVLFYIIIVIMAFVFAVTASSTVVKEANVIGTLRASGYTRRELIIHYMEPPIIVTLVSAVIGNICGYTFLKDFCADMYYGSYSLPTYVTLWNAEAFVLTTIVPIIMMIVINYLILSSKLKLSPLKFLRRDLSGKKQKRAMKLNYHLRFFARFRIRVILQNLPNYFIMLVGIMFANILLIFGMAVPAIVYDYQDNITDNMLCEYTYVLTIPDDALDEDHKLESMFTMLTFMDAVSTENEDAEKMSAYSLVTDGSVCPEEEVALYGIEPDSRYVKADVSDGKVWISSSYAEKYKVEPGDTITLYEEYEDDAYSFNVYGIYDYDAAICVFMSREMLNETFDYDKDFFCGYFSDSEITDIDKEYIGSVIDATTLTKVTRQLMLSMGGIMDMVLGFAVAIFIILIYLLSKICIEKNAQSISMAKILGYSDGEISRLYIVSTSIVVVIWVILTTFISDIIMEYLFRVVMMQMVTGWIAYELDPIVLVEMIALGIGCYAVVAILELFKIKRVPMDSALKNVE